MANCLTRRLSFWRTAFKGVRALIGIIVSILTLFLGIRDGVIDPKYRDVSLLKYLPHLDWYWWLVIGVLALALLALEGSYRTYQNGYAKFRAKHKTRIKEIRAEFQQREIHANTRQLITVATETDSPKTGAIEAVQAAPNLVCLGDDHLYVEIDRQEVFRQSDHVLTCLRAITVKFRNAIKPGEKIGSIGNVRAHIVYYDLVIQDRIAKEVDHACWLNEELPDVSFGADKLHHLILGTLQPGSNDEDAENAFTVYENDPDRSVPLSKTHYLHPKGFRILVQLVAGEHGEFSTKGDEFEVILKEGGFIVDHLTEQRKREIRERLYRQLTEMIREGEKFFVGAGDIASSWFYPEAHQWRNRVDIFIRDRLGLKLSMRFRDISNIKAYPYREEVEQRHRGFLDELHTRFINLSEITKEFSEA